MDIFFGLIFLSATIGMFIVESTNLVTALGFLSLASTLFYLSHQWREVLQWYIDNHLTDKN